MIMAIMDHRHHVPAWRKLGLKLKSEEEKEEHPHPAAQAVPTIEATARQHPKKKRKLALLPDGMGDAQPPPSTTPKAHGTLGVSVGPRRSSLAARSHSPTPDQVTPQTSPRKRKSVSFTPDTKAEDGGSSGTNLQPLNSPRLDAPPPSLFDVYMNETTEEESIEEPTTEQNGGVAENGDGSKKNKKTSKYTREKEKREKKKKEKIGQSALSEGASQSSQQRNEEHTPTEEVPPQLKYLDEHYRSRSTWKFNKAKQTWLLKHAFDLDKIPSSYDTALDHYLRGLDSDMARLRLFERAKDIVAADDADASKEDGASTTPGDRGDDDGEIYTTDARVADVASLLKQVRAQVRAGQLQHEEARLRHSTAFQKRLFNRARAEMVLWRTEPRAAYFTSGAHPRAVSGPPDASDVYSQQQKPGTVAVPNEPTVITYEQQPETTNGDTNGATNGDGAPKRKRTKRHRQRKRRTGVADDDTSSSESSDGSGADEDAARADAHARAIVLRQPLPLGGATVQLLSPNEEDEKDASEEESTSSSGEDGDSESGSEDGASEEDSDEDESE